MKYISLLGAAMVVLSSTTMAADSLSTALDTLRSSDRLSNFEIVHDKKMSDSLRQKLGFKHEVIKVAGSRMGLDIDRGVVYQLSGAYMVNGLFSVQETMVDLVLTDPANKDWFPISMPEGTDINATVYVFTDPTCGYCRKMHEEKSH